MAIFTRFSFNLLLLALVILSDVAHCNDLASCDGVANERCCKVIARYINGHNCNALCSEVKRYSYRITNEMIAKCWVPGGHEACRGCTCKW